MDIGVRASVGPFVLGEELGRGGMGAVFSARHVGTGTPVAIKLLTAELALRPGFRQAFRREVHAMARLHHPNIAMVLDCGELTTDEAEVGLGPPGSPWLAMERLESAQWSVWIRQASWERVIPIVRGLLKALAHAHALGVLHRDLKPANILMGREQPKLVDFGISRPFFHSDAPTEQVSTGTVGYMAPEQIRGKWRSEGPWTDLYALGCTLWTLITGRRPFSGGSANDVFARHLSGVLPALNARFPHPPELEGLLGQLLARDPRARPRRAADVARAFEALVEGWSGHAEVWSESARGAEVSFEDPTAPPTWGPTAVVKPVSDEVEMPWAAQAVPEEVPHPESPFPATWRAPSLEVVPLQVVGAGLGLYGLRHLPVVGRDVERDVLWDTLGEAIRQHEPRVIAIRGAAGVGKSRLAEWLAERGHEVGAVTVLRATHSEQGGALDGLGPMMARGLHTVGLEPLEVEAHIRKMPGLERARWEAEIVAHMIAPGSETLPVGEAEQVRAVIRILKTLCDERPLLLHLDDVQWGSEALALCESLLEVEDLPVCVVLTAQEEALEGLPAVLERMLALREHSGVVTLRLEPLTRQEQQTLVQRLLRLSPELAQSVVRRTGNTPLFAVQLVRDWVDRGLLVPSPTGFVLTDSAQANLPDDLHALWMRRLKRIVGAPEERRHQALERAAALGRDVSVAEWQAACGEALETEGIVDALVERRLARRSEDGWSFEHEMLRESLERVAREAGRYPEHHAAVADVLEPMRSLERPDIGARLGEHLAQAGRSEEALDAWFDAARSFWDFGSRERSSRIRERRSETMDALALPHDHRERVRQAWLNAREWFARRDSRAALQRIAEVADIARAQGWDVVLGQLMRTRGMILRAQGQIDEALASFDEALTCLERASQEAEAIHAWMGKAVTLARIGRFDEAQVCYEETLRLAAESMHYPSCLCHAAGPYRMLGEIERARSMTEEALERAEAMGDLSTQALAQNNLGEIARDLEAWDEARTRYEQALELWTLTAPHNLAIGWLNISLTEVGAQRYEVAEPLLSGLRNTFAEQGLEMALPHVFLGLSCCALAREDTAQGGVMFEQAGSRIAEYGSVDRDLGWLAEQVAAAAPPYHALVDEALELARAQYEALGDEVGQARVREAQSTAKGAP